MLTFNDFLSESAPEDNIRLTKVGSIGGHYEGTHKGVKFEIWKSVRHTNTSRPSSRDDQRRGYGSFASSRKDTTWNWRPENGQVRDGYGSKKEALAHIVDLANRKQANWKS